LGKSRIRQRGSARRLGFCNYASPFFRASRANCRFHAQGAGPVFFFGIRLLAKRPGQTLSLFRSVCPPRNSISDAISYIEAHQARESPKRMTTYLGDLDMKKFLLASVALVALTG